MRVWLVCLSLCLAAPALAQDLTGDATRGAAIYDQTCKACHGGVKGVHLMPSDTPSSLDRFLTTHKGRPDAQARADLIAYLLGPQ